MNGEQAARLQQLLEEACDHFIEDGGTVVKGNFGRDNSNRKCPMSCLFGDLDTGKMAQEASSLLETPVSGDEIWAFIVFFDQNEKTRMDTYKQYVSMMLIGKQLREKYIQKVVA